MNYYLFGLHRSGTNIVAQSIGSNFKYLKELSNHTNFDPLWKHSFIASQFSNPDYPIFIVYKHIYMWLESILIRSPYNAHHIYKSAAKQIPDFFKSIDKMPSNYHFVDNIVTLEGMSELYFEFLRIYKDCDRQVYFIKYEDLLTESIFNNLIKRISEVLNLPHQNPIRGLAPKVHLSPNFNSSMKNNYITQKPKFLPEDALSIVSNLPNFKIFNDINSIKL